MYQKTIVRYELNPRYKVDEPTDDFYDKWEFPCFLGVDDNNDFIWYENDFETIASKGNVHKLFFIEDWKDNSNPQYKLQLDTVIINLMDLGLIVKNKDGKTYKYVWETYKFEKLIIKEILGIDADLFETLSEEKLQLLDNKLVNIWKKQNNLFQKNKDCFVDFYY